MSCEKEMFGTPFTVFTRQCCDFYKPRTSISFYPNIYLWWTKDQLFMSWGGRGGVTSGNIGYSGAAGVWKTSLINIFPQHNNNTHSYIQSTKSYTHSYIIQLLVALLYIRLKSKINKHRSISQFIMLNYKIFIEEFV